MPGPGVRFGGTCALCHCSPEKKSAPFLLQECGSVSSPSRRACFGMRHLPQTLFPEQGSLSNGPGHGGEALPARTTPRGLPLGGPPPPPLGCGVPRAGLMDATARKRLLRHELLRSQLSRNKLTVRKVSSQSVPFGAGRVPLQPSGSGSASPPVSAVCLGDGGQGHPVSHCRGQGHH